LFSTLQSLPWRGRCFACWSTTSDRRSEPDGALGCSTIAISIGSQPTAEPVMTTTLRTGRLESLQRRRVCDRDHVAGTRDFRAFGDRRRPPRRVPRPVAVLSRLSCQLCHDRRSVARAYRDYALPARRRRDPRAPQPVAPVARLVPPLPNTPCCGPHPRSRGRAGGHHDPGINLLLVALVVSAMCRFAIRRRLIRPDADDE
jgi:hypothetical protein